MKAVVDVNFAPSLAGALRERGVDAVHWTAVGAATAADAEILAWAARHEHVVVTQDLDHSDILA
jgi:predicted nuclease of predicted toxin-antitoxin system